MLELEGTLPEVYLQPGELHLARKPVIIRTLLGSCVGVTFWSAKLGVGALCHALLPKCPNSLYLDDLASSRRYVDFCVRYLARKFDELGAHRSDLQVKLFGGADVLLVSDSTPARPTVGKQNCQAALEVVSAEGFAVSASSLGGTRGRSIRFNTGTGEVLVRRLSRVLLEDVTQE